MSHCTGKQQLSSSAHVPTVFIYFFQLAAEESGWARWATWCQKKGTSKCWCYLTRGHKVSAPQPEVCQGSDYSVQSEIAPMGAALELLVCAHVFQGQKHAQGMEGILAGSSASPPGFSAPSSGLVRSAETRGRNSAVLPVHPKHPAACLLGWAQVNQQPLQNKTGSLLRAISIYLPFLIPSGDPQPWPSSSVPASSIQSWTSLMVMPVLHGSWCMKNFSVSLSEQFIFWKSPLKTPFDRHNTLRPLSCSCSTLFYLRLCYSTRELSPLPGFGSGGWKTAARGQNLVPHPTSTSSLASLSSAGDTHALGHPPEGGSAAENPSQPRRAAQHPTTSPWWCSGTPARQRMGRRSALRPQKTAGTGLLYLARKNFWRELNAVKPRGASKGSSVLKLRERQHQQHLDFLVSLLLGKAAFSQQWDSTRRYTDNSSGASSTATSPSPIKNILLRKHPSQWLPNIHCCPFPEMTGVGEYQSWARGKGRLPSRGAIKPLQYLKWESTLQ